MSYRPELENLRTRKLLKDVYHPNSVPEQPEDLTRPVQHFLTKTGAYKHTKVFIAEKFEKAQKPIQVADHH